MPGNYLLLFLLCQSSEGLKWDDIILAKDIIAHDFKISLYLLRKYLNQGIIRQQGRYWSISESRATFKNVGNQCTVQFCGDPSIIWGLYRRMSYSTNDLPLVEIIDKRSEIPFLNMKWDSNQMGIIREFFIHNNVSITSSLWRY